MSRKGATGDFEEDAAGASLNPRYVYGNPNNFFFFYYTYKYNLGMRSGLSWIEWIVAVAILGLALSLILYAYLVTLI